MTALYATAVFKKDAAGNATTLIWRQKGEDTPAKKVVKSQE
jgi:hypothetical protein